MKFNLNVHLTLLMGLSALVHGAPAHPTPGGKCNRAKQAEYCAGTAFNQSLTKEYVCGDSRLGPIRLPERMPLDTVLDIYDRFDGRCPGEFLKLWFNTTSGWWNYPPQDGFSLDSDGRPIKGNLELPAETLIDRFGSEYGSFASPAAAPYMQRALPPSNLDTPQNDPKYVTIQFFPAISDGRSHGILILTFIYRYPFNYHVYRLTQPLTVLAGPIAPWFGQPGQGVQYMLYNTTIMALVDSGVLERVEPSVILD
jgi:hypothetical protein